MSIIEKTTIRLIEENEPVPYTLLLDADPSKELIDKYLLQSELYVAIMDGRMIGCYVFCILNDNTAEIKNIAVAEKYQRMGLGAMMLNDAEMRAKGKGIAHMLIGTGNASFDALKLYQRQGYEMTAIKKNYILENYKEPIFENGIRLKHVVMLEKPL